MIALAAFTIGLRTPRRLPLTGALIAAVAQARSALLIHLDEYLRAVPPELFQQKDLGASADSR
jgi:hypothetical protein